VIEGKKINLRLMEKEDFDFCWDSWNKFNSYGDFEPLGPQLSKSEMEQRLDVNNPFLKAMNRKRFIIEKKDGTKIGGINHFIVQPHRVMEIGFAINSNERGKGFGTEAVQIMVDYLFLTNNISRIQAITDTSNLASKRVLEKSGFTKEGTLRQYTFTRGKMNDKDIFSIVKTDWKEPKILSR